MLIFLGKLSESPPGGQYCSYHTKWGKFYLNYSRHLGDFRGWQPVLGSNASATLGN